MVVADESQVDAVTKAIEGVKGVEAVSPPVAQGDDGVLLQATLDPQPYSTEAFDLVEPIRDAADGAADGTLVGGATAVEFDVREAAARDSILIPPIVLVVVFLILMLLLRAVVAPLILIGTVILSFAASLGRGLPRVRRVLRLPRFGPVPAPVRVRVPGRARGRLQHLPRRTSARGDPAARHPRRACCVRWRSRAA